MRKRTTILNHGSIAGLAGFLAYMLLFYAFGLGTDSIAGYMVWPIPIYLFYRAIVKYRDEEKEGFISYGSVVSNGVVYAMIYSSMVIMLTLILAQWDASYLNEGVEAILAEFGKMKDMYIDSGQKTEYEMIIDIMESYGAWFIVIGKFFNLFFANIISALILAFFVKTEKPIFDENEQ